MNNLPLHVPGGPESRAKAGAPAILRIVTAGRQLEGMANKGRDGGPT